MGDNLTLNISVMDTMHSEFLTLLASVKECKSDEFVSLFKTMLEHTKDHFKVEEEIMGKHDFYDKQEHIQEHETIISEMEYFYEKAKKIPAFGKSYVNQYAYDKFKRHILNIDSQLAMYLKTNDY